MLYCNYKPFAPFFTMGMSSPLLDRWALELQHFNIKFQHIQGKRNVVADAISQLRNLGLYQDNGNEDVPVTTEDVVENIIEVIHLTDVTPKIPMYNVEKLNLDILRKEQQHDQFCKNKVKEMKTKPDTNFPARQKYPFKQSSQIKIYSTTNNSRPRKLNQSH